MKRTIIQEIASLLTAIRTCALNHNTLWADKHRKVLRFIEKNYLPSGSGIDYGTKIESDSTIYRINRSNDEPKSVILYFDYHHMNENGFYTHWSNHTVRVTPTFSGINIAINKGSAKDYELDYFYETFDYCLSQEIDITEIYLYNIFINKMEEK